MKRRCSAMLLVTLILGLILPMACAPKAEVTKAGLGNTNANIVNMGMAVADGDWIYFLNVKDNNGALYKMKKDGSEESLISKDQAGFLNFVDGYIYYCNGTEASKIYRIKPDGTERSLVSDFPSSYLIIDGDWLYALDNSNPDDKTETKGIYRSKLDGTERTMVGQADAVQFNLAGDTIYYLAQADQTLHSIKTDGTEDKKLGEIKAATINVLNDKIYYVDSSEEASQIWSVGLDGTGAARLSEDKATAINVSGDWIYYGHPKDEMMAFEFKKMKLDGTEPSVVNGDMPMVITVHDDLLGYLQMDFSTFSMSQVFVRTDGTGRKEFKLTPESTIPESNEGSSREEPADEEPPDEEPGEKAQQTVVGQGMTVTVDQVYATNLVVTEMFPVERFLQSDEETVKVFITFIVTNDGDEPLEVYKRVGIYDGDRPEEAIIWFNLADVGDRKRDLNEIGYLVGSETESGYGQTMVVDPGEGKLIQAEASLEGRDFPVNFTLFDDSQSPNVGMNLDPDRTEWAVKPEIALTILREELQPDNGTELTALEPQYSRANQETRLLYPFEVKEESGAIAYYIVDGITQEIIYSKMEDGRVVPAEDR